MPRKQVASYLWDSDTEKSALVNLRQLLMRIRKVLGENVLAMDGQNLWLERDRSVIDLCLFEARAQLMPFPEIVSALLLFRGDLLAGQDDVSDTFSHWLLVTRAALRERFFNVAAEVLKELTRYGRGAKADLDAVAERMLALEPEREASYRALIEAYGRNGMFNEAEQVQNRLLDMLKREGDLMPSRETMAVARRVLSWRTDAALPEAVRPPPRVPRVAFLAPIWPEGKQNGLLRAFIEDVANELSRYRSLAVLAPHSSLDIQHDSGLPRNGGLLRADFTISGFVQPGSGDHTLTLRMVDCGGGTIVWSGEFPVSARELSVSFRRLVFRVAASLASALERHLLAEAANRGDAEAYVYYLQANRILRTSDLRWLRRARGLFTSSLKHDPFSARARAGIAQTLYLEWLQLGGGDPQLLVGAREHAQSAVNLDVNDAVGHWMEGTIALYQREFDHCAAKMAEAEPLCPNSPDFLIQYGDALAHLGQPDTGWQKFEQALDLNPAPPDHYWWAGASIAYRQQNFAKAIELCGKLASEDAVLGLLAASYAHLGDIPTARSYGARVKELFPGNAALERDKIIPDREESYRASRLEGLRLAGVFD